MKNLTAPTTNTSKTNTCTSKYSNNNDNNNNNNYQENNTKRIWSWKLVLRYNDYKSRVVRCSVFVLNEVIVKLVFQFGDLAIYQVVGDFVDNC